MLMVARAFLDGNSKDIFEFAAGISAHILATIPAQEPISGHFQPVHSTAGKIKARVEVKLCFAKQKPVMAKLSSS